MNPAKIAKPPASTPKTPDARSPSEKKLPSGAGRRTNSIAEIVTALATTTTRRVKKRFNGRNRVESASCAGGKTLPASPCAGDFATRH